VGGPLEIVWRSRNVETDCTECAGTYGERGGPEEDLDVVDTVRESA